MGQTFSNFTIKFFKSPLFTNCGSKIIIIMGFAIWCTPTRICSPLIENTNTRALESCGRESGFGLQ